MSAEAGRSEESYGSREPSPASGELGGSRGGAEEGAVGGGAPEGSGWRRWVTVKGQPITLNLMRIMTGFLFLQHGLPKVFGILSRTEPAEMLTRQWFSGVLEVFGGFLVMIGLFVQPVAFILSGEMAFAYFLAHAPRGFWPVMQGGELAALYCFVFLYLAAKGGGGFSVDGWRSRRKKK